MTTDDQHAADDGAAAAHDFSYAEALAAAQPRIAEVGLLLTALGNQVMAAWQEIEPLVRTWVDQADKLTAAQWRDEPASTRAFYEAMRQWFAEHPAELGGE